ncbi:MAG: hypothetical protein LBR13_03180 [Dysgonamonadaceae bacterium]|nr:hypothetical protein [Dysgonamonadaceae bacterium]
MKNDDIFDDEIQILGLDYKKPSPTDETAKKRKKTIFAIILCIIALAVIATLMAVTMSVIKRNDAKKERFESIQLDVAPPAAVPEEPVIQGYIEVREDTVNDVALRIYIPHNVFPELSLTMPDEADETVVFVTQAADVGKNNYGIIGDFVLAGEQLAHGVRKEGYCAIIDKTITVGVSAETSLLEQAINAKGYFFRQYPLVKNSEPIENNPKNKSIRRALAIRENEIIIVESRERESFHDFAVALADAGVSEGIYLVGSDAVYGWWRDEKGKQTIFGEKRGEGYLGSNYLIWRKIKE